MNRKAKKSPPKAAKKIAPSRRKSVPPKNRNLSKLKGKSSAISQKKAKSSLQTVTKKSPAIKSNLTAKSGKTSTSKLSAPWLIVYGIAITLGISTILGTTIAIASSFQTPVATPKTVIRQKSSNPTSQARIQHLLTTASLGQEIRPLKTKIESLAKEYPELEPRVFLVDLDTKGFVSMSGQNKIASASTIKLPILVAFLQDLDRGKVRLEEQLTMTKNLVAGGSGDMQHQPPGTKFTALETAEKMITISDNTATNMLIDRLGGMAVLNKSFQAMGLTQTELNNPLPDLTGTNTTSPQDLGNLLIKIDNGRLLSLRSRDRLLHIMGNVEKDTLLPHGLESGALIAHKTGDIKSVLADVGTIDMPNGKRYIASILVKRPDNSPQAQDFIQKASEITYQYFKNPHTNRFTLKDKEY